MLLPELLTYEGLPHSLRAIGALPAAILIAAFAAENLSARWKNPDSRSRKTSLISP